MKTKPISPYERLRKDCAQWAFEVIRRSYRTMWTYPNVGSGDKTGWRLDDLYQRVAAADQLGYDVVLATKDHALEVRYVKRIPDAPWAIRPNV